MSLCLLHAIIFNKIKVVDFPFLKFEIVSFEIALDLHLACHEQALALFLYLLLLFFIQQKLLLILCFLPPLHDQVQANQIAIIDEGLYLADD